MGDDYTEIPVSGVSSLTAVRLYDETLGEIAKKHVETTTLEPSLRTALVQAVADPTSVHISTTDPDRAVVFVNETITPYGDYVIVPVRRVTETSGRIVTAYITGDTYRGTILWSTGDE